jgi:hypothetical protein
MQISTRREVLQATGLGTALALAGCSGNYLPGSDTTTKLGRVEMVNRDTSAHTVHIQIRRGDELVHDQPYNLSPDDPSDETLPGIVLEQTWSDTPGRFSVEARLNEGSENVVSAAAQDYPGCLSVLINIDGTGNMALFTSSNSQRCNE